MSLSTDPTVLNISLVTEEFLAQTNIDRFLEKSEENLKGCSEHRARVNRKLIEARALDHGDLVVRDLERSLVKADHWVDYWRECVVRARNFKETR